MILLTVSLAIAVLVDDPSAKTNPAPGNKLQNRPDTVRCVKMPVTGSLAQFRRICMTNREWEQNRDDARRMQSLTCSNGQLCQGR